MIHFDYWCDPAKKGPGWVHFLRAKESYATFAVSERAAMPDISVMALVAKGLKGEGWKEPTRYAHVKTHWTGFHYIQGGHCWSHKDWVFNEDVAAALDRGETVELVDIPVEQMRGWYRCTLCDLVVHDPECPSCSKSCPVCEIVEAERDVAAWVSSNDHLRFVRTYDFGQPFDEADEGPGDETTTDNVNELVSRAGKHTTITRCAVSLLKAKCGEIDVRLGEAAQERLRLRRDLGASIEEIQSCAVLHLHASERCLAKAWSLISGGV